MLWVTDELLDLIFFTFFLIHSLAPRWGPETSRRCMNELLGTLLNLHLNIYAIWEDSVSNSEKVLPGPPSPSKVLYPCGK